MGAHVRKRVLRPVLRERRCMIYGKDVSLKLIAHVARNAKSRLCVTTWRPKKCTGLPTLFVQQPCMAMYLIWWPALNPAWAVA